MKKVEIPKILFLALDIAGFYRSSFFNTSDLAKLSNRYKSDLVRLHVNKKDYKYLDDTRLGGLRGNFSTLLTWRGLVKRGSSIVNSYSLGRDNRLVNAVHAGKIILNRDDFAAYTKDEKLAKMLEAEAWLLNVRESQAHVKLMLEKNPSVPLKRDVGYFPKESVFISENQQYFIRGLVNNFADAKNEVLQYRIINLWEGKKFKTKNLHPLIVLPTDNDPWGGGIFAVKNEELYPHKPILLNVSLSTRVCKDNNGVAYTLYPLTAALAEFSRKNENIETRLNYVWEDLKVQYCTKEVSEEVRTEDEFSNFLRLFLDWQRQFHIDGKDVVDVRVISSGGPDVELIFSGGTKQRVELEHQWNSYLDHAHHLNNAFRNAWVFAEEEFDFSKITKLFGGMRREHHDRIPEVFLSVGKSGKRGAHRVDWENSSFEEVSLVFKN